MYSSENLQQNLKTTNPEKFEENKDAVVGTLVKGMKQLDFKN